MRKIFQIFSILLLGQAVQTFAEEQKSDSVAENKIPTIQSTAVMVSETFFSNSELKGNELVLKINLKNSEWVCGAEKESFSPVKDGETIRVIADKPLLLKGTPNNRILFKYGLSEKSFSKSEKRILEKITGEQDVKACFLYCVVKPQKKEDAKKIFRMIFLPKTFLPVEKVKQLRDVWCQSPKTMMEYKDFLIFAETIQSSEYARTGQLQEVKIENPDLYAKSMDKSFSIERIKGNILKQMFQNASFTDKGFSITLKPMRFSMRIHRNNSQFCRVSKPNEKLMIENNTSVVLSERNQGLSISPYQSIKDLPASDAEHFSFLSNEIEGPVCVLHSGNTPTPCILPHKFQILIAQSNQISNNGIEGLKTLLQDSGEYLLVIDDGYIFVARDVTEL